MSDASERTSFALRIVRTARLHADTYEEVEADRSSIWQALAIVVAAGAAAVVGSWLRLGIDPAAEQAGLPLPWHLAVVGFEPIATWLASSAFAYMVGATFFRGPETETDYAEVLRTTGFAFAPGVLAGFAWLQPEELGLAAVVVARIWVLVASVVAVRQALDFTTLRAIGTYGLAFLLMFLVLWGLTAAPLPLAS
jgi:hypothetical protein